jgi:hypothetical protein
MWTSVSDQVTPERVLIVQVRWRSAHVEAQSGTRPNSHGTSVAASRCGVGDHTRLPAGGGSSHACRTSEQFGAGRARLTWRSAGSRLRRMISPRRATTGRPPSVSSGPLAMCVEQRASRRTWRCCMPAYSVTDALAAGWLSRAQRLVARSGRCVEQCYVALACAYTHRFDLAHSEALGVTLYRVRASIGKSRRRCKRRCFDEYALPVIALA